MALERIGAVAGVFTDPGGGGALYLDFTDAGVLDLVETGDTLVLIACAATIGGPSPGTGWTQRATPARWEVWTKIATAREAFPTVEADDAGNDAAGVLLVYRGATEGYLVGDVDADTTAMDTEHPTPDLTVIDSNGRRMGVWLGAPAGDEPDAIADTAVETVLAEETSDISGTGVRWFVVAEAPIDGVPTAGQIMLETGTAQDMDELAVALRDRPPPRPAPLAGVAFVNLGLVP